MPEIYKPEKPWFSNAYKEKERTKAVTAPMDESTYITLYRPACNIFHPVESEKCWSCAATETGHELIALDNVPSLDDTPENWRIAQDAAVMAVSERIQKEIDVRQKRIETLKGLLRKEAKITIIKNACNSPAASIEIGNSYGRVSIEADPGSGRLASLALHGSPEDAMRDAGVTEENRWVLEALALRALYLEGTMKADFAAIDIVLIDGCTLLLKISNELCLLQSVVPEITKDWVRVQADDTPAGRAMKILALYVMMRSIEKKNP